MNNLDIFGDDNESEINKKTQSQHKKCSIPLWTYALLGIATAYLVMQMRKKQQQNQSTQQTKGKSKDSSNNDNDDEKSNGKKKNVQFVTTTKNNKKTNNLIFNVDADKFEEEASIQNTGPASFFDAVDEEIDEGLEGTTLERAFAPFENGGEKRSESKVVYGNSFYEKPHVNKNGLPAVTKQGLQDAKLRSLSKHSKQDRTLVTDYRASTKSVRPLNAQPSRGKPDYPFGKIEKLENGANGKTDVNDANLSSNFGTAYE